MTIIELILRYNLKLFLRCILELILISKVKPIKFNILSYQQF